MARRNVLMAINNALNANDSGTRTEFSTMVPKTAYVVI